MGQDAYISDVVVVVDETAENNMDQLVDRLKQQGMCIENINRNEGIVEGSVDASKLRTIDDLPGVEYVRSVFTYVADYPAGDPRDRDGQADE